MTDKIVLAEEFTALAPHDGMTVADLIEANTGGQGMTEADITRLSIPAGGAIAWEVPTIDGEDMVKDLHCVILAFNDHRVFYPGDFSGESKPPQCSSKNMKVGQWVENYDDEIDDWNFIEKGCANCEMNQWGTKGRGKACAERRLTLVLTPGRKLPFLVDVSPGSMRDVRKYFNMMTAEGKVFFGAVTNMKLVKAESGGGIKYSQIQPQFVRDLTRDEFKAATEMREAMAPALEVAVEKPIEGPL